MENVSHEIEAVVEPSFGVLSSCDLGTLFRGDLPHAKLVEITDAGHAMMYEYPLQLANRVDAFIQGRSPTPNA